MSLSRSDFKDEELVDSAELGSDGYSAYKTLNVTTTTASTKTIVVAPTGPEFGLIYDQDAPVASGDRILLAGTSGGAADGYYLINAIVDNSTFTVIQTIADSTGGTCTFIYPPGASLVGFDPTGLTITNAKNVQEAIKDIALEVESGGGGGGFTDTAHRNVRQLIHFINEGPAEGFATNAYKEILLSGDPFPTSVIWWVSSAKTEKIVEKTIVYNSNKTPDTITWEVYDADGVTVSGTVEDAFTYSGVIETTRTRTITENIPPSSTDLTEASHRTVRQLIHFISEGPAEGFATGAFREATPSGDPFPTSIIWWTDSGKTEKIVEKTITRNANQTPNTVTWEMYDVDGATVVTTVVDTHSYSGIIETDRTRSIS